MDITILERFGFWGLTLYLVVDKAVIPTLNKYFPRHWKKIEADDRRRWDLREREIVALEQLSNLNTITNERLSAIERGMENQTNILVQLTNGMAVLLEKKTNKK